METTLWKIFDNVNRWLEFAEKKNAFILTFIGIQITLMNLFGKNSNGWFIASLVCLGCCLILSILSFFPKTNINKIISSFKVDQRKNDNDNLIYYQDIAKYSIDEYIHKMERNYNENIRDQNILVNLCNQIVINSKIAAEKYWLFKIMALFILLGQVFFINSYWC